MPNAYINKLVKQGKGSKAKLEKKWEDAKAAAAAQGHAEDYGYITSIFQKMAHVAGLELAANSELNTVCVDVPLFIRLLELARETLKTDEELHDVVEKVLKLTLQKDVLTMKDYPQIWDVPEPTEEPAALARLRSLSVAPTLADKDEQTLNLTIKCRGDAYFTLINLLGVIQWNCDVGHTATVAGFFDGDGADKIQITGLPKGDYTEMAQALSDYGDGLMAEVGPSSAVAYNSKYISETQKEYTRKRVWPANKEESSVARLSTFAVAPTLADMVRNLAKTCLGGATFTPAVGVGVIEGSKQIQVHPQAGTTQRQVREFAERVKALPHVKDVFYNGDNKAWTVTFI